jgi:type IV pilus assembly protein PilV
MKNPLQSLRTAAPARVCRAKRQAGFTLIEIMVAVLIFSFGLLGLVGLQSRAIEFSTSAEDSNRAALLANDIGSLMVVSSTVTLPQTQLDEWQAQVADPTQGGLPSGVGTVAVAANVATITIEWGAPSAASGASKNRYITSVMVPTP